MVVDCRSVRADLSTHAALYPEAPLPPLLQSHLAECEPCRLEWRALLHLSTELQLLRPTEKEEASLFVQSVTARIRTVPNQKALNRQPLLRWGLGLAAAGLCVWAVWPSATAPVPPEISARSPAPTRIARNTPAALPVQTPGVPNAELQKPTLNIRPRSRRQIGSPKRVEPPAGSAARTAASASSDQMVAVGASNTAEKFAQWGEYYAQSGVYAHAADAYGAAAATSNSPTLVYQAGCAAEMAGDVGSAVEYYARLLQATPPAPVSNKEGKTSWTEPHPSA